MHEIFTLGPRLCALSLPKSEFENLSRAFFCGVALPPSRERELILDAGVIHLLVVSGIHLFYLEKMLQHFPRWLRLSLLSLYAFFTGFGFPILRALSRRIICPHLCARLGWTVLQAELAGALLFLLVYPPALLSRSFLMCWMGGIAMSLPPLLPRFIDRPLKAYVLLWPFCFASPVTLFWNVLLAPWFAWILFPSVLSSVIVHALSFLSDGVWRGLLALLEVGPSGSPLPVLIESRWLCWLPLALHFVLIFVEVQWRRARAFSCSPS